jgi:hypothetical protein
MRIRNGLGVLICCCAGLAACTAAPKGPDTTVTTPAVGRPLAPVSAQAALSSEAFTPYAGLGAARIGPARAAWRARPHGQALAQSLLTAPRT